MNQFFDKENVIEKEFSFIKADMSHYKIISSTSNEVMLICKFLRRFCLLVTRIDYLISRNKKG